VTELDELDELELDELDELLELDELELLELEEDELEDLLIFSWTVHFSSYLPYDFFQTPLQYSMFHLCCGLFWHFSQVRTTLLLMSNLSGVKQALKLLMKFPDLVMV